MIFTEIGDRGLGGRINTFLHNDALGSEASAAETLALQRDLAAPLWDKPNYSYFLTGLHSINQKLSDRRKISVYPTDIMGMPEDTSPENVREWFMRQTVRDSLMAGEIIRRLDTLPRGKALVIMNSRHAFKEDAVMSDGSRIANTGRFLAEHYPGKVASVMINTWKSGEGTQIPPFFGLMQDGRWDAAFKSLGIENAGFDMKSSPFGRDEFDYSTWLATQTNFGSRTYEDIFDGFVFYQPMDKFKMGIGLDGFMEDGFYEEFVRRATAINEAFGRMLYPVGDEVMRFNKLEISPMNDLDRLEETIGGWLK